MNDQHDLFGAQPDDSLIHAIDQGEFSDPARWPLALAEMTDRIIQTLGELGHTPEQARLTGQRIAADLAIHHGGSHFYMPKGDSLKRSLRDQRIWAEHDGTVHGPAGVKALARKHRMSDMAIYKILKTQRQLHLKSLQGDLFEGKKS